MATLIKYVAPKDVKTLNKYFNGNDGVTLIFSTAQTKAKELGIEDGKTIEYDFGGEADVWLDLVYDEDHQLLQNQSN
jgi:hypothetical protein